MRQSQYQTTTASTVSTVSMQYKGTIDVPEPVIELVDTVVAAYWLFGPSGALALHRRTRKRTKETKEMVAV